MLFLFTALPEDWVQAFCTTSVPHRVVVSCDSTAFLSDVLRVSEVVRGHHLVE